MKRMWLAMVFLPAALLAACGGSPTGSGGAAVLPGQSAADANATLAAVGLIQQATAEAHAQQTAVAAQATAASAQVTAEARAASERATADYVAMAQATAAVATADAQATSDALVVESTRIAQAILVSEATRVAAIADAAATQEATNLAMVQADTAARMEQQRRREETRLAFQPALYVVGVAALTALALAAAGFVVFLLWRAMHLQRHPVVQVGDGYVAQQSRGLLASPQLMVLAPPRPALPAPRPQLAAGTPAEPDDRPIPLPRLRRLMHVLIAGPTDAGKSNAARALLTQRQGTTVLDPHSAGDDWGGATVIGAGRDFDAIREYIAWMEEELTARYQRRQAGEMQFQPHTVVIDEMPAIVSEIGRDIEATWRRWLREGRKVGLFLILLTQSTRVRTLGIQGEADLLENFGAILILGDAARQEYGALVAGMERPAVLRLGGRARPVIIPHVPEGGSASAIELPAGDLDGDGRSDVIILPPTTNTAPVSHLAYATDDWPRREPEIDINNIDARARQRIIDEYKRCLVFRQVQLRLFPSYADDGGRAGRVIREVLAEAGMVAQGADGRWQPTARAMGY